MARRSTGSAELEFLQAFVKRGFVNIPRVLFDYTADLGLDYDTIGKIFAVLACVGGPGESPFAAYTISRRNNPRDYDQVRLLLNDLEQKDIIRWEQEGDAITFSLIPLFSMLKAIWEHYREQCEAEAAGGVDPAIASAEKVLGRPLSDREVREIQDWMATYHFDTEMVIAVCREGISQGVTRINYLNQIALQWHEEGIQTPAEAEGATQRYRKAIGRHKSIIQYLGLKRQLTGAEQSLLDKWSVEWAFSNEVIIRACTEAAGSKNPLQYINRVLESWLEQGVKTVSDVDQALSEHKRKAAAPKDSATVRTKPSPARSNVFLQRGKKDEKYYDHVYKPFGD